MTNMAKHKTDEERKRREAEERAYYEAVGRRLQSLIDLRGLTQTDVERRTGLEQTRVSKWTKGQNHRIFAHQALALARVLGVTVDDLLDTSRELEPAAEPSDFEVGARKLLGQMTWEEAFYRLAAVRATLTPMDPSDEAVDEAMRKMRG